MLKGQENRHIGEIYVSAGASESNGRQTGRRFTQAMRLPNAASHGLDERSEALLLLVIGN